MKRMTADEHRAAAQAADQAAYDSFERCDTDGFLSQWASGLNAQKHRLQAEIEDNGGKWEFPALFDLDGNLVPAKLISTRYGMSWALLDPANPEGSFLGFFNDSQAAKGARRLATDRRKGYTIGTVRVPAVADMHGANACSVSVYARR